VAAEAREFSGLLRHAERVVKLNWPVDFARKIWLNGRAALLVANGPGPKLAGEAVEVAKGREELTGLVSTGFCGALDPALKACDIFVATEVISMQHLETGFQSVAQAHPVHSTREYATGGLLSQDSVICTADGKSAMRKLTGAGAVEMEAVAVAEEAAAWNITFYCIRVVTDGAREGFPLDFNRYRHAGGRFSRARILAAALRRPWIFLGLLGLNQRSKHAAQALGDFLADTRF
jgi:adenosylhomocysteine nucleosidase